jgi:ankyrin repeat protein
MGDIFRAAGEGNEGEVIRLLDADPTLLEREDDDGDRPLAVAALSGRLGVTTRLIERGANINATGAGGNTALHYAARRGYEEVVVLLLREGAQANTRDNDGMTPLMWACVNGHLGVVKMLVQHMGGQGLDNGDDTRWRELHFAAYWGHEEVVRFLLLAGADPTITDSRGSTPRALAEQNDYHQWIREARARCVAVFQVRRPLAC